MKRFLSGGLLAIVLVAAALLLAACGGDDNGEEADEATTAGETAAEAREPLVIGYAATLSGFSANADQAGVLGARAMVDKLNQEGGIDGHEIELVVKDMQSDPALGASVTQELLDAGAAVVLGPPFPGQVAGVVRTAAKEDVPVLSVTTTGPEYTVVGGSPAFLTAFGDNAQAAAVAEYALDEKDFETSFYMTSPDLNYTSKNAEWFAEAFEQGGGRNLGSAKFTVGQQDFSAQVTRIANLDPEPDIIYASMFMPDAGTFVQQLRAAGVESAIGGGDGFDNQAYVDFAKDAANGTIFSTHGYAEEGSTVAEFTEEVTAFNDGKAPDNVGLTALGGDALLVIKAAVEEAGSIEPAAISEALGNLQDVEVVTGTVTFAGTSGVPEKTVYVVEVEDGAFALKKEFVPEFVPEAN
jgi:branched-chain amino acid transport system substrate-binding protein